MKDNELLLIISLKLHAILSFIDSKLCYEKSFEANFSIINRNISDHDALNSVESTA